MSYCHDLVSVEALRARIAALEGTWQHATASDLDRRQSALPAAPFGLPPVDRALPWGELPTACLHELTAAAPADGSAAGFAATLFSLIISAYPFVDVVDARAYAAKILGTTLVSNLIGTMFFLRRRKTMGNPTTRDRQL